MAIRTLETPLTARTIDDGLTHEVTRDQRYGPVVACGANVAWTEDDWLLSQWLARWAERREDREVDCMACITDKASMDDHVILRTIHDEIIVP